LGRIADDVPVFMSSPFAAKSAAISHVAARWRTRAAVVDTEQFQGIALRARINRSSHRESSLHVARA